MLLAMCSSEKNIITYSNAQAPLVIYKTRADYSENIPVVLNAAKDKIISYPAVSDISFKGQYRKPVKLKNGFLLDNLGLSPNSAYTSFTWKEYASLEKTPSPEELLSKVIDADPFIEMFNCGGRSAYSNIAELNEVIENNFKNCKKVR